MLCDQLFEHIYFRSCLNRQQRASNHRTSEPSPLRTVLPSFQPTFTRKTSGHCLGTFHLISVSSIKRSVSRYSPTSFFSSSLSLTKQEAVFHITQICESFHVCCYCYGEIPKTNHFTLYAANETT